MHGVAFPKGSDGWSRHQANTLLRAVEDMFQRADIEALVNLFAEDCVFRFAEQPEQKGRVALRRLFLVWFARQQDYRLKRACVAIDGNKLTNKWEDTWTDKGSGKTMAGIGLEVWTMRDARIAVWEAAFNIREEGGALDLRFIPGVAA